MKTMIKYLFAFLIVGIVFSGCTEQFNLNEPSAPEKSESQWLKLPAKSGVGVEVLKTLSKSIDGAAGGSLFISNQFSTADGKVVTVEASLEFPAGSFAGEKTISMTLDDNYAITDFQPASVFDIPAKFSYKISGFELNNTAQYDFVYGAPDGSVVTMAYDQINVSTGSLEVKNARLPHFSKYGVRIR